MFTANCLPLVEFRTWDFVNICYIYHNFFPFGHYEMCRFSRAEVGSSRLNVNGGTSGDLTEN